MDLLSPTTLFVFRTSGGYTHLMIIIIIIIYYDDDRYSHARLPFLATFCLPCLALPYLTLPTLPITRLLLQLPSRKKKKVQKDKKSSKQQQITNNKKKKEKRKTMSQLTTAITNATSQQHPYYPLNALIPHYRPNTTSVPTLLLIFFASCTLLLSLCYFFATRIYAASSLPLRQEEEKSKEKNDLKSRETGLSGGELSTLMWFVLSGTIHVVFEGYYVRFYDELAGKEGVLGEMWKEYAFSDSR